MNPAEQQVARYYKLRDIVEIVREQLPRTLRDKFRIELACDAYFLRCMVMFIIVDKNQGFSTELEGTPREFRIPEQFLAFLCALPV
jgi:hypothetical protein